MAKQSAWRWCQKCQGLFFSGNPSQGSCPAGGSHDASQSGPYAVLFGDAIFSAQNDWRWCQKCQGLFYAGNASQGVDASGGPHDGSASGHYSMLFGDRVLGTQGQWRWCQKCQGLFFSGNPAQGPCPAGGNHDGSASGPYGLPWENSGVSELDFDTGVVTFGGGVPVGGSAQLAIRQDGSYNFVGHFHKSSILPYDYSIALAVLDIDGRLYTFSHQYSFGSGVADDNFPYNGNNPSIAENWTELIPGFSFSFQAGANLDAGSLISSIVSAVETAGAVVSTVIAIV